MALDNLANLKASIENWSHRQDVKAIIDDFIQISETEMYSNSDFSLRIRSMEQVNTVVTTITDNFIALPTNFLESRRLEIIVDNIPFLLEYKTPEQMSINLTISGVPKFFTITDKIEFEILPNDTLTTNLNYYGSLTPLSAANPVNAILTDFPNIYLYGSLRALNQFANDTEEEIKNFNRFIKAIQGANLTDKKGRYGPVPRQRIRGATP